MRKFFYLKNCRPRSKATRNSGGFTLLELMIVITMILILLGIALVRYERSVQIARETVLRTDLREMNEAIERYATDKEAWPSSLDDLVSSDSPYLDKIPVDPVTHQKDWRTDPATAVLSPDQSSAGGICRVHSNAPGNASDGTPYSEW